VHSAALFPTQMAPSQSRKMTTRKVGSEKRMRAIARSVVSNQLERKNNTVAATSVNATTAGAIVPISNGITEGDDVFQRSGTVIRLARIRLLLRGTAVTTSGSLRYILFRDMLSQQAFPPCLYSCRVQILLLSMLAHFRCSNIGSKYLKIILWTLI
jgi:hypothetical protein